MRQFRRILAAGIVCVLAAVTATSAATPGRTGPPLSPTELAAKAMADATPDPDTGWLPVDWARSPLNPVHRFVEGGDPVDRIVPTVMRVDDKIANPLDHWYMWVWRHGRYPRTADNGGRMILLTAPSLEGPWTDRGFVTPQNPDPAGYGPYGWTGGDVVWSPKYHKFFSFPHAATSECFQGLPGCHLDTFEQESPDGVNWTLSNVPQPVLAAGPGAYDDFETGYGRLLRVDGPKSAEKWIWLYRSGRGGCTDCADNQEYYTFSIATADDIYGPWTKDPANPVFDPFAGSQAPHGPGALVLPTAFLRYQGYYEMIWQDNFAGLGHTFVSRSKDLHHWEDLLPTGAGDERPLGQHRQVPFYVGMTPLDVGVATGSFVWDDRAHTWCYVYLAIDAATVGAYQGLKTASVDVMLARSISGGDPPRSS